MQPRHGPAIPPAGEPFDLAEILQTFRRRSTVFLVTFSVCVALALLYFLLATRRYKAEAELQVLGSNAAATLGDAASGAEGNGSTLDLSLTVQTYLGILTADRLALEVAEELNLESTPEFKTRFPSPADALRERSLPLAETRYRRDAVQRQFKKSLEVSSVSGSRLITATFLSRDPDLAARILDHLLAAFERYNSAVRYESLTQNSRQLRQDLELLRVKTQLSQEKAASLQRRTGSYGIDETHNLVLSRLDALNQELTATELNLNVKQAVLEVVRTGGPEALSSLSSTAGQSSTPGGVNSLALLQSLREQETTLTRQYADLTSKFGNNYPRVPEMRSQLVALRLSIAEETGRLTQRATNDYRAALGQDATLRSQVAQQKELADEANDLSIQYVSASRDATSNRELYEHLLSKLNEADLLGNLQATNVSIVDAPHVGVAPDSPKKTTVLGGGLAGGLLLAICAVFLVDSLDGKLPGPAVKRADERGDPNAIL